MELKKISLSEIIVNKNDNVRENYGDLEKLQNSMSEMKENLVPILVVPEKGKYKLVYGYRRFECAKNLGWDEIKCIVQKEDNPDIRFLMMYHENIGREDLKWHEESKALALKRKIDGKLKKEKEFVSDEGKERGISSRAIEKILQGAKIIKEYPSLKNESSRNHAIEKYSKIKKLEDDIKEKIKKEEISIDEALKQDFKKEKKRKIDKNKALVDELKKDSEHYEKESKEAKEKLKEYKKDIFESVKKSIKEERIEKGIWLEEEVEAMIDAAVTCESFGNKDEMDDKECKECKKTDVYNKCQFWYERKNKS